MFFTVAFLVPGFIWESVLRLFLRRREDRADRAWVRFLTLSAFNYAFWSWLIYLLFARAGVLAQPWVAALAWFFILLVSPMALGAATGFLSQRATVRRLLARYGVYTVHPVPTAWDYVFSHSERDLFLERLYEVEDDGPWQPMPMNRGVWIRGEAIRAVDKGAPR